MLFWQHNRCIYKMCSMNNSNNIHKWMLRIAYTKFSTTNKTCMYIYKRGFQTVRTSLPDIYQFISGWGGLTHRNFTLYIGTHNQIYKYEWWWYMCVLYILKIVQGFRCQGSFSVYLRVVAYMVTFNVLYIQWNFHT